MIVGLEKSTGKLFTREEFSECGIEKYLNWEDLQEIDVDKEDFFELQEKYFFIYSKDNPPLRKGDLIQVGNNIYIVSTAIFIGDLEYPICMNLRDFKQAIITENYKMIVASNVYI